MKELIRRINVQLFTNHHWTVTPAISFGREPGCWGYPGCYWAAIEWLRFNLQVGLHDWPRQNKP